MKKKAIIIPNIEKLSDAKVMMKELSKYESHALGAIEFSNTYNLALLMKVLVLLF